MAYSLTSIVCRALICLLIGAAWSGFVQCRGYNSSFRWTTSQWSPCRYKDPASCCHCYRVRNVSCVYSSAGEVVPPFYCHKSGSAPPADRQPCTPCEQDCVLSSWSGWSPCTDVCTPGTRFRTRDVILPPQNSGAPCGALVEIEECRDPNLPLCIFRDLNPQYRWTAGPWSSCRQLTNTTSCGEGVRVRKVVCVDNEDNELADSYCLYYLHGGKPANEELCYIPCDCDVSPWTAWGPCSKTCYKPTSANKGYQVRTRSVKRDPDDGGAACPALKDTKPCDVKLIPRCPRYVWHSTDWEQCTLPDPEDESTLCGPGVQTRDVYCTLDGDPEHLPVADVLCIQESRSSNETFPMKPPERRACQVQCPKDCLLGEWENWSSCTQTCGSGGVRIRTRPVIQEMTSGGQNCVTEGRYEETPCDPTPCSWWHTGQWSACFLDSDEAKGCGVGSQVRSVYCLNALDEVIPDDNCTVYSRRPARRQPCRVPCPDVCTVSSWSAWTECSRTCGVQGGVQTRYRQITDVRNSSGDTCLPESELRQSRVCNQIPCKTYLWQIGPWSDCVRMDNATEPCGEGTGTQRRQITCQMDRGYPVSERHCDPNNKPSDTQICAAPCPQDCKLSGWSDWSLCSKTCGADSYKVKFKMVLRWPLYGGKQCPGKPDENGIILKRKLCNKKSFGCAAVHWETSEWDQCQAKGQAKGHCGKGTQKRNVTCIKEDGKEVNQGVCYEEGLGSAPDTEQSCHVPCPGDCRLSQWSEFTPCSQTCGAKPGVQTRTRYVINWDPSRPLSSQCPHLEDTHLTESIPCAVKPCPQYSWYTGTWSSCIPHNTDVAHRPSCGDGVQVRHVFCFRDDNIYVPDHMCDVISAMPRRQQKCHVPCPVDCVVSAWSVWSNCSHQCGNGVQHRVRKVIVEPADGGRACPTLEELKTCTIRECGDFDWAVSNWEPCKPHWGMHCGPGIQQRQVTCPAGQQYENDCAARQQKPPSTMECFKPCAGDCIMSEWSEFSQCDCGSANATRTRFREIRQKPLPSAVQCGPTTDTELCECPSYQLVIGGWTRCQLLDLANEKRACGKGIRRRPVNCVRDDGIIVHLSKCQLGNLTLSQSCDVDCPKDCQTSGYSDWSDCSDTCGTEALMTRHLNIVQEGNDLGRRCPPEDQLTQVMVCNSEPCYNYTWYRGPWQGCHNNKIGSCGVTRETRVIDCHRSDGTTVSDVFCFQNELHSLTSRDEMTRREKIRLDLDTERSCGEPCPGDCVVTEWSEYGPCIFNCSHPQRLGVQTRSRAIVRPSLGGAPCPWDLIQIRNCEHTKALCPLFSWEVTNWNSRNRRKVHCVLQGGLIVNGGCILSDQPAKHKDCPEPCAEFASCFEGKCVCDPGFVGNGSLCLPEFGCAGDQHCYLNNTYCDLMNKECLCLDDSLPGPDLTCVFADAASSSTYDPLEELNQLFIYILIGCLIALLLLGVVTIGCMIRSGLKRRRRHRHRELTIPNKLTKIDNLDTMPKNNNKTSEPKTDRNKIDKNWTHSLENRPYRQGQDRYQRNLSQSLNADGLDRDEAALRAHANSAPKSGRGKPKLANVSENSYEECLLGSGAEDAMSSRPFLADYNDEDQPKVKGQRRTTDRRPDESGKPDGGDALPRANGPPRPPTTATPKYGRALGVPSPPGVRSRRPSAGDEATGQPRPDSYSQSTLSTDSDMTTIWIPHVDAGAAEREPEAKANRFPIASSEPSASGENAERPPRPGASTPPHVYENLLSDDGEKTSPEWHELDALPALATDRGGDPPTAHQANKRRNTEPVPTMFRNGGLPNGPGTPTTGLAPPAGLTESTSAKDIKELQAPNGARPLLPDTQDLMSYCDQLLADLQRVANS